MLEAMYSDVDGIFMLANVYSSKKCCVNINGTHIIVSEKEITYSFLDDPVVTEDVILTKEVCKGLDKLLTKRVS